MTKADFLINDLPDTVSAQRFLTSLAEKHRAISDRLLKNTALLSDVLTLTSFSPLLSATLLQNPEYLWWLERKRSESGVRNKDELTESLARFSLTNSQIEPHILLARFRRRELLRIFLIDIRGLSTIAETTEEISNLADAILENALRLARQELDNRYGSPLEIDSKGREKQAEFCIVSLGKLGSRELNYASDIDLLFIYSEEGSTSGSGSRGQKTNREYFVKLAEIISKLIGQQSGEGAAYRVDMRLRPHGRVGSLALSLGDTVRYYNTEAAAWERQVLIRSRSSAGDANVYKKFFRAVENSVFSKDQTVENALSSVRFSKEKIDLKNRSNHGFNVKLGKGGIREIEFIAQALQLAYGGNDKWLRVPHTLKSLSRLADRKLLTESELTQLFDAYEFLRQLEHILQMENGLQTHTVPDDPERRDLVAKRMNFAGNMDFESSLTIHTKNVSHIFIRIFGTAGHEPSYSETIHAAGPLNFPDANQTFETGHKILPPQLFYSLQKSGTEAGNYLKIAKQLGKLLETSPRLVEMVSANPGLIDSLPDIYKEFIGHDYKQILHEAVVSQKDLRGRIKALRHEWSRLLLEIIAFDVHQKLSLVETKQHQTALAEASIETAILIARNELEKRYNKAEISDLDLAVIGLGKLGSAGIDYDSDLDLVFVYDETEPLPIAGVTHAEFHSRAVEIIITALSSMTRDGSLYRIDLRLRPHGKNGAAAISRTAFRDYMQNEAAIWELLAYVKIRAVCGGIDLAKTVEHEIKEAIHKRALNIETAKLAEESVRIRSQLEMERSTSRHGKGTDIKFGPGGMLDIYFAIRFLQLRDGIPDDDASRSTGQTLTKLLANNSLSETDHAALKAGYEFLSELDHNIRLTVGRTTRLPLANQKALRIISNRMNDGSPDRLIEELTFHRLNIRSSFENILDY